MAKKDIEYFVAYSDLALIEIGGEMRDNVLRALFDQGFQVHRIDKSLLAKLQNATEGDNEIFPEDLPPVPSKEPSNG